MTATIAHAMDIQNSTMKRWKVCHVSPVENETIPARVDPVTLSLLSLMTLQTTATTPRAAVDGLRNADRACLDAAKRLSTADALAAMFAEDITTHAPGNVFVWVHLRLPDGGEE